MCENQFCKVRQAIAKNIVDHVEHYDKWRHDRFNELYALGLLADIELDRRRQRKRRRLEGW